jgi:hypothetical protein
MQHFSTSPPLSRVVVTIGKDGTIDSTLDGQLFLAGPLGRDLVGHLIDCIAKQHGGPIRLEVREAGRVVELQELIGEGFIPGESVAIAVILGQRQAGADGRVYAALDGVPASHGIDDVILFGASSGTLVRGCAQ